MKILCFIDSLGSGGAQRQLVELAKGFKEEGHQVSFLTYHDINFFKAELDVLNIPIKTVIEPNYLKRLFKIRKEIRKEKPDAVLSFLEAANFMATLSGFPFRKWKLIVGERSANPRILKSFKLRFYRWFHLFADYVVANSHENMEMVSKINPLLSDKKKKVIYNIINPKFDTASTFSQSKKTKIVIAASYIKMKNLEGLIDAVKMLTPKQRGLLEIRWYGSGRKSHNYRNQMQQKIDNLSLSHVFFLNDATNNICEKYMEADFVGLFSDYEGFPNTICEAMICQKPVIVTEVSDIPLFIKESENGFLCTANDINSIKKALERAIESNHKARIKMGVANKELAEKTFKKGAIIKEYIALFR